MTLDQLTHFYETARRGHLGNAAASLRLSPSAISYSINCLESELGVRLFEKRGKRIFLTAAGERLMEKIPQLQNSIDDIRSHVSSGTGVLRGHYSIAGTHMLAHQIIPVALQKMIASQPKLSFEVVSMKSSDIVSHISESRLNLGLCFNPQNRPDIESRVLCSGQLKVFVRKNHPILKQKNPISLLNNFGAILPKAQVGIEICESHPVFDQHGIRPRPQFVIDSYDVGIEMTSHSDAWGFFPDVIEKKSAGKLEAVKLPKTWNAEYHVCAIWNKNRALDIGLSQIIDALARAAQTWRKSS